MGKNFVWKTLNILNITLVFIHKPILTPLMFKNSPSIWNELTEHQNYICYNSFWKHLSDDGILATFQKQQKCNAFHLECWYLLRKVFSGKTKYLTNNLHLRGVKRQRLVYKNNLVFANVLWRAEMDPIVL